MTRPDGYRCPMSETSNDDDARQQAPELDDAAERREIAEVEEELDDRAEGEGLAAEAGRSEENGLSEG